ncbi:MAG: hypothetical protein KDA75_11440, partial [Planctomycetaceae bacterium]|nr:hypothetical protein [Planctomycetaceae bacterium]
MTSEAPTQPETPAKPSLNDLVAVVTDWLRLLIDPDGVVELRALKCQASNYRKPHTRSGFFDGEHLEEMDRRAVILSRDVAPGVYLTLNPVHRDLLSRRCNRVDVAESGTLATDANITCRRWLLVDADPIRIADVSSTNAEKALALETVEAVRIHLREQGWPEPILADSGNGYHLLYRIDLPVDDGGLVERCLKALAGRFDNVAVKIDTKVFNPSRIVKLYGTASRKGDNTPERPHRRSRILETPDERIPVPIALLESLAATAPAPAAPPPRSAASGGRKQKSVFDRAQKYLAKLPAAVSGEGGHSATFRAACALVLGFDLSPDDAYPLLMEWNQTHCEPPWDEHELRHKLQDADKKEGERGYLLNQRRNNGGQQRNGHKRTSSGETASTTGAGGGRIDSPPVSGADPNDNKPSIDAGNRNLQEVTAQAWAAIDNANHPPFLFRYGGLPGRIERDDHDEPIVRLVDEDRMRHVLARVAHWTKEVGSGDEVQIVDAMPPKDVVKDVLATPDMPLPVLTRIVEAPVFASD